jgi:hypothetical protein
VEKVAANLVIFSLSSLGNQRISDFDVDFKLVASLKTYDILATDVARLHKLDEGNFTFGKLFTEGNYDIIDPYFSVGSIIQNTIGSAQFSIQTSITLLVAWLSYLCSIHPNKSQAIIKRYLGLSNNLGLEDFCAIGGRILIPQRLRGTNINALSVFWDRLLLDISFMKKYVLRTDGSKMLVHKILAGS